MNIIGPIAAIIAIFGAFWGAYSFVDNHYAKVEEVKLIEQRLDYKIDSDKLYEMQNRLWKYEDRYKEMNSAPPEIQTEWKNLKYQFELQKSKVAKFEIKGQ